MKKLFLADIKYMATESAQTAEGLDVFAGKGDLIKVIMKAGLRIRHTKSGLVYTVINVDISDIKDPQITCRRLDRDLIIKKERFKEYERH